MTNNNVTPLKLSKQVWIFVGFLLFLVPLLVVSTVVDVVMEKREHARRHLTPAFEVTRESAGEEITHAVGVAVEKYQAILDRQWTNPDCTPDHCADSTATIPGDLTQARPGHPGRIRPACVKNQSAEERDPRRNHARSRRPGGEQHPNLQHEKTRRWHCHRRGDRHDLWVSGR